MRVLIVSQNFWPEGFRINEVAKSLSEKGVEVEILTGKPNYPAGKVFDGYQADGCLQETFHGIPVHRVPLRPRGRGAVGLARNYLSFVLNGLVFAPRLLRGKQFDAIFVYATSPVLQALPAIYLGWLKKTPVALWVQDLWPESLSATGYVKNRYILKAVEWVVRYIYKRMSLLLVQSEAFFAPVGKLAPTTEIRYYPNSVDDSFARPVEGGTPGLPGLNSGFSVMFAGNIGSAQAVEVIVEAATILAADANIQFVVVGDGSRRDWMLQEIKARGLNNVHLPGRFPSESMPGFMQQASALLVTLADEEIFAATVPNKIQAYLAAGRPIIASVNGEGARLVLAAAAGVTAPAQDGAALAEAIRTLYAMPPAEREQMGANGRAYYRAKFDHESLVSDLIRHLQTMRRKS